MNASKQNRFILSAAAHHLVEAYRKTIAEYQTVMPLALGIAADAPDSYEALVFEGKQGMLRVSTEFNSTSIYGAAGNLTFRTMHDYGHLIYAKQFTPEDETALAHLQWADLKAYLRPEWVSVCHQVYFTDTVGQLVFESINGHFLEDQKAFALEALNNFFKGE